jgi:hypothetical protein
MLAKFFLFALIIFMSIAINLPDSMLTRMGLDANYLLAALVAMVIAGLSIHRHMLLVVLILGCAVGANLSAELAAYFGVDRDILLATLFALIIVPFVAGKIDFQKL